MADVTWDAGFRATVSWNGEPASARVTWTTTPPAEVTDDEPSLDFSDPNNSQYLPL